MKPCFLIILAVAIACICTASMLFFVAPSRHAQQKTEMPSTVEIRWGEGSEAGVPGSAVEK